MEFEFIGAGEVRMNARLWAVDQPKMVVQITHGMTEYMGRYDHLAKLLNEHHIAAAGFDLRGHGANSTDPVCASLGQGGWENSLEDMHRFYAVLKEKYPDVPHAMLGFSLGSFLLRDFLNRYDDEICGAAILGTGDQPSFALSILKKIIQGQIRKTGFNRTTVLVKKLSFGAYNQKFAPNRTPSDWLCADEGELDAYRADPMCCEAISSGLFWQLLDGMQRTGKAGAYDHWNHDMPVLLLSGQKDAVGDFGKGVRRVESKMKKAGMRRVQLHLIPDARHDVLHETSQWDEVQAHLLSFFEGLGNA